MYLLTQKRAEIGFYNEIHDLYIVVIFWLQVATRKPEE